MASSPKARILVVDDSRATLEILQRSLTATGYMVFTAADVNDAVRILEHTELDLVITDLKMPKVSGLDLVKHVRANFRDIEVIMITGYPSVEGAVSAIKNGARNFWQNRSPTRNCFAP